MNSSAIFLFCFATLWNVVLLDAEFTDENINLYWEKGNSYLQVGLNNTILCYLQHIGSSSKLFQDKVYIVPPRQQNRTNPTAVSAMRLNGKQKIAKLKISNFSQADEGEYECIWENIKTGKTARIKKNIYLMTEPGRVEIIERSREKLRLKEGEPFSLSASIAVYPDTYKDYTAKWSRTYKLASHPGNKSEQISNNKFIQMLTITEEGHFSQKLDVDKTAVTADQSGIYILTVLHRDAIETVQWEVEIENEHPKVHMVVVGPSFTLFNQTFYKPDQFLRIDCVALSIPASEVTIEVKNQKNSNYNVLDNGKLNKISGTFENGYSWNTTFAQNAEVKCHSQKNGKTQTELTSLLFSKPFTIDFQTTSNGIVGKSKQLYEGDGLHLECITPNLKNWTSTWIFNDRKVDSEVKIKNFSRHLVLNVKNVNELNSGNYKCVLSNGIAEEHRTEHFNIVRTLKPFFTSQTNGSAHTVNYNEMFVLDCGIEGIPPPTYSWYKKGETSKLSDDRNYTVHRARHDDAGVFECVARNRAGVESILFEVKVEKIPENALNWKILLLWCIVGVIFAVTVIFLAAFIFQAYSKRIFNKYHSKTPHSQVNVEMPVISVQPNTSENVNDDTVERILDFTHDYINLNTRNCEIASGNLKTIHDTKIILGAGQFGQVLLYDLQKAGCTTVSEERARLGVAVKKVKKRDNEDQRKMIKDELEINLKIGKHPNVLAFIGYVKTCQENLPEEISLVFEFINNGSLKTYLKKQKNTPRKMNGKSKECGECRECEQCQEEHLLNKNLCQNELISFGMQIANGMEYLSSKSCVHRDLAIRNVLVNTNKCIRICDFGFGRIYEDKNYYRQTVSIGYAPIQWWAPENLHSDKRRFTEQSDVWSFGICLYELFSIGKIPYSQYPISEVEERILEGEINDQPDLCPDEIYEIMKECWHMEPSRRPTFTWCNILLRDILATRSEETLCHVEKMLEAESKKQEELEDWL